MRAAWNDFFHATERPDGLALVRILLCAALLVGVLQRLPHARELVSLDGAGAPHFPQLAAWMPGGTTAVALYALLALALMAGLVGWQTRIALAVAVVLYPYLGLMDGVTTLTKYTIIGTHGLFLLAISPAGAAWSVDARLSGRTATSIPIWPRRLLQLLLCVLYFATAITKVQTPAYHSGDHFTFWLLTDMNAAHPLGHWLAGQPTLVILAAQFALLWESLFGVLVWVRPLRKPMLALGVSFHLGTYLLLGLWLFPLVMLALYPAFVTSGQARSWLLRAAGSVPRPNFARLAPLAAARSFALVAVVVTVSAVEAEYRLDPLDQRHPDRRPQAVPLSPSEAAEVLRPTAPLEPRDWVHRVHVGRTMIAGVVQTASTFAPGEPSTVQAWVHQPHPDFWLQIDLVRLGSTESVVMESGVAVLREMRSAVHTLVPAAELTPGRYAVVLKYQGEEFRRTPFDVQ